MNDRIYTLIEHPVISEKSTVLTEKGQIVFRVLMAATKPQIKKAVEVLFKVKVKSVNIIRQKGKRKRFQGIWGRRNHYKKAIITLEKGENIELLTGAKS